ncbi:MAG: redoxin domain-containing protein [bacterium]
MTDRARSFRRRLCRAAAAGVFLAAALTAPPLSPGRTAEEPLRFGRPAPDFTLKTSGGKTVKLRNFRGKNTVVAAFWMPGYPQVIEELEKLQKILEGKKYRGVKVVAITRGKDSEEREKCSREFESRGLRFPILFDPDSSVTRRYEVTALPSFYIVDRKGRLASAPARSATEKLRNHSFAGLLEKVESGAAVDVLEFQERLSRAEYVEMLGAPMPSFHGKDMSGVAQSPAFYAGFRRLIVVLWQPWCPHCRKELRELKGFYDDHSRALNFEIVSVTDGQSGKNVKAAEDFIAAEGIGFPVVLDPDGGIFKAFKVTGVPMTAAADLNGTVREIFIGEIALLEDTLTSVLESIDRNGREK